MKTVHRILTGDSRKMQEVKDTSVHLVVTSPPYWQLKDYGSSDQIGFNHSYEEYINNLNLVWNECYRVIENGCRLCINIGDQFARSVYYGRYKVIPIRTEIIKFCETIGFDYMGAVIWQKVTTCNTTGGASVMGSFPYPRNGILKLDYEFILIFKKQGVVAPVTHEIREKSKMTTEEWNQYFSGHWNFPGEKQGKHLAMFPEELPKRLIKMFTFVGDTVLDPFLGSGTTMLAAKNLSRNSVGYEINGDFLPFIKERVGCGQSLFSEECAFEISKQEKMTVNFADEIQKLPYIFNDPIKVDKKIDPKKLQFGSKIDQESGQREEYFTVKEVVSPELIKLSNGLTVRLLGIKQDVLKNGKATEYLVNKTQGQKVFLKYDQTKYDSENRLLCYLYLKNKTFVNAHLVKEGLAVVDVDMVFKYKEKFLELQNLEHAHNEK
ncbi:MAG: DNA methylase N-4 [Candidatus Omnitrophica bacterium CG07_land_8_20_14_0_80_42_15]|uniref:Methyltransferase n=1 Tax=Candidatus Aquitaenariimonas noxiae TaxID=1974741 RepID=A0A2J0KTQ3_9BACT|nr:MAG: DNA methylase N-4 [Candidatus Omnitrophica bacterium CG07_land_8_20_14_0_80_42_15]